ncbi:MAG: zinc ribbon domain-containing protein, partial [Armatimonadota bacterium]
LEALSDGTQERAALEEARAELKQRQERLAGRESERRSKDLDLGSTEAKRAECMAKAYGGVVSNPKELENLEKEIEALGRTKDRLEEEIIELLDQIDEDTAAVQEHEALVAECEATATDVAEHYASESARLSGIIAELEVEREQVVPQIEERLLKRYDELRAKNANLAVSEVIEGVCSGCNMTVPSAKLKRLSDTGGEIFCDNCKRFLYLLE